MKLNSVKPEGYPGKLKWKNYIPSFLLRREDTGKYQRSIHYDNVMHRVEHPIVSFKDIVVPRKKYVVKPEALRVSLPIPRIDMFQFLTIVLCIIFMVACFFSMTFYFWAKEDIEYRQMLRQQVIYNVSNALLPYDSQVQEMKAKLNEHDAYIHALIRGPHIKQVIQYEDPRTGKTVWK